MHMSLELNNMQQTTHWDGFFSAPSGLPGKVVAHITN
jgi:hypothetical protein